MHAIAAQISFFVIMERSNSLSGTTNGRMAVCDRWCVLFRVSLSVHPLTHPHQPQRHPNLAQILRQSLPLLERET